MWFPESKFNLFQNERCIRVRTEADEVVDQHSAIIWGCCSWSGPYSITVCAYRLLREYMILNDQSYSINVFVSLLISQAYSKMPIPGFIGFILWGIISTHLHRIKTLAWPRIWDVLEKALLSGLTLPSSIQNLNAMK